MYIHLDHHSGEPIYRQIVEAIKYRIACGRIDPEEQLPSIRVLAEELKINPRTVVKAYEELQHAGLVVMRQGQGVFVRSQRQGVPTATRRKELEAMARRLLAEADRMGAGPDEVMEIVQRVAREMERVE
jgi:GntR family transcriptional regulator